MYVHAGAAGTPCWCRASCWAVAYALSITLRGQTVSRRACALSRTKRSRASFRPRGMTPSGWSILRWGARPPDWLQRTYLIHVNERLTPRQLHHLLHQTTLHFYDWLNVTLPHWHAFSLDRHPVRVRARKQTSQPATQAHALPLKHVDSSLVLPPRSVMTDAHSTLTRATTASRKSTIASRNASLIKKNTGPLELRPSDILIERFTGTWLSPFCVS